MRAAVLTFAVLASACGGGDTAGPSPVASTERLEQRLQTEHFRIVAGTAPEAMLRAAADRLEAEYGRITTGLGVPNMPVVTVRIWQDENTYFSELTRYFGVRYQSVGYITGVSELAC